MHSFLTVAKLLRYSGCVFCESSAKLLLATAMLLDGVTVIGMRRCAERVLCFLLLLSKECNPEPTSAWDKWPLYKLFSEIEFIIEGTLKQISGIS